MIVMLRNQKVVEWEQQVVQAVVSTGVSSGSSSCSRNTSSRRSSGRGRSGHRGCSSRCTRGSISSTSTSMYGVICLHGLPDIRSQS